MDDERFQQIAGIRDCDSQATKGLEDCIGAEDWLPSRSCGGMARRIFQYNWTATSLGKAEAWPLSLRSTVSLIIASKLPMYICWGPDLTLLYNDSYGEVLGSKHPGALGQPIKNTWPEIWNELEPVFSSALAGRATFSKDFPRVLYRGGAQEQTNFTFSTSPIYDDANRVAGVFCACLETTQDVINRAASSSEMERLRELFSEAPSIMAVVRGPDHVFEIANSAFQRTFGKADLVGHSIREALPELQGQDVFEPLDRVYATGEAVIRRRTPLTLKGNDEQRIFVDVIYQPLRDASRRITGIFIEGGDVTEAARADERRIESERFTRATIDALSEQIAVVDDKGRILAVNKAWRDFAMENPASPSRVSEGVNYLTVCDDAAASGMKEAADVAATIREIASGKRDSAALTYPCHLPTEEKWFRVTITRFADGKPVYLVVSHDDVTERIKADKKIEHLATHDTVTGLPNRNLLIRRAEQAVEHSQRSGLGFACIFIDLDNFKHLNDAYGHSTGDCALRSVAGELLNIVRVSDTVARLGGDEFVVILTGLKEPAPDASRFARSLLDRLSAPMNIGDRQETLTASIGISLFPADGSNFDQLLKSSDAAMYAAKHMGRNGFELYTPEMTQSADKRIEIGVELRRALQTNQLELRYQPQVKTMTGETVGVEALLRWKHSKLGIVSPSQFIPIAEETGLIVPIGLWVLRTACEMSVRQQIGLSAIPVAVNISPVQLRQPDFVKNVADILSDTELDPSYLELEITESLVTSGTDSMIGRLRELKNLGLVLSIDDFGTGYSNLGYLKKFSLDKIKIDQSFIRDLPSDPHSMSIVCAIVAMANSLGLDVIAEGVETAEQAKFLVRAGCHQAQGYFYSAPLKELDIAAWIKSALGGRQATPVRDEIKLLDDPIEQTEDARPHVAPELSAP